MGTRLEGKTALITGAGTGIGRACALAFVREGARVALMGRRRVLLEDVARGIGAETLVIAGDVTRLDDVRRAVAETVSRFGGLNVLVNNAGVLFTGTAESHTEEEWDQTYDLNVKAVWRLSREVLPHMRRAGGGSIINLSSILGVIGVSNRVAYGASKGAVTMMTKCMALDHAEENIRVNCICPAVVETELAMEIIAKSPDPAALRQKRIAQHPLGRLGRPEDVAMCAVYLASDESSWVTGGEFPVDGGYTAQ